MGVRVDSWVVNSTLSGPLILHWSEMN